MDRFEIERVGGFAGFGGSGSHLRSRGQIDGSRLSTADKQAVEALFSHPSKVGAAIADGFRYRITHHTVDGSKTVEIPEEHVPAVLKTSVKDEIV